MTKQECAHWNVNETELFDRASESSSSSPVSSDCEVFVGGLLWDADKDLLTELFADCGEVKKVTIPLDPVSKHCRGFAFVTFSDAKGAQKAVKDMNKRSVDGMTLIVSVRSGGGNVKGGSAGRFNGDSSPNRFGVVYSRTDADARREAQARWEKRQERKLDVRHKPF